MRNVHGRRLNQAHRRCNARWLFVVFIAFSVVRAQASGAQLPSLFHGVVVADSPLGVRVISVDESSQAYLADVRPEDLIVRIDNREIHSIDEFATVSNAIKGQAVSVTLTIFRNGAPRDLMLHLYSYPILRRWGIEFLPNTELRFAQPDVGRAYWTRLGRGFEEAGKDREALDAYLNSLHLVPEDTAVGMKVAVLSSRVGQQRLREGATVDGLTSLRTSILVMQKLFEEPLNEPQLRLIKDQLHETLEAIREASRSIREKSRPT